MDRSPLLATILVASAILFGPAGTAGAQELCGAPVDQADPSGDTTCSPSEQSQPLEHVAMPAGQSGVDELPDPSADPSVALMDASGADVRQDSETVKATQPLVTPPAQTIVDDTTIQLPDDDAVD